MKLLGLSLALFATICGTTRATVSNEPPRNPVHIPFEATDAAVTPPLPLQPSPYVPDTTASTETVLPGVGLANITFGSNLGAHAGVDVLHNGVVHHRLACERIHLYYANRPAWFCYGQRVLAGEELRIRFDDMSEDFCPETVDVGMMDRPSGLRLDAITTCSWHVSVEP